MESSRLLYLSIILCLLQTINLGPLVAHSHSGNVNVGEQPLSKIAIHRAIYALDENSSVKAYSLDLGTKGEDSQWVMVQLESPNPSVDDWVAVFFLENLNNSSTCAPDDQFRLQFPYICTAPIEYKFANKSNAEYIKPG